MSWLQRIVEVIAPHKQPPPNGVLEMQKAMKALEPSTRRLEERIRQPLPSVGQVMRDVRLRPRESRDD